VNTRSAELTEVLLVQPPDAAGLRLRTALIATPELEVVKELTDASAAVDAAARLCPHVVLLRVELSDISETGVLGVLRDSAPRARIVLHAQNTTPAAPGSSRWFDRLIDVVVDKVCSSSLEARLELPDDPESVPLARHLLNQLLGHWELDDFVDLASLLITELVANALRHVPGTCAVELSRRADVLRIVVVDTGPGMPDLLNPGLSSFGGRGLHIVSALATAWGTERLEDGCKAVWAEIATPAEVRA
jgi:signal transduction histidine kinase